MGPVVLGQGAGPVVLGQGEGLVSDSITSVRPIVIQPTNLLPMWTLLEVA